MLLGDFIKELKHNSLKITLYDDIDSRGNSIFTGTFGELKNNIQYQNNWCKWRIKDTLFTYDKNMKNHFQFIIKEINYERLN